MPAPAGSGLSATRHSVVSTIAAIDAAFCSAARVTLAGSMMPALIRSVDLAGRGVQARSRPRRPRPARTTTEPSRPALLAMWRPGATSASHTVRAPVASSPSSDSTTFATAARARMQGGAATGDHAFLDGRTDRRHGVLDAVLLLLELHLGGRADLDHGHAAGQLGETLLELLTIPVGVGVLDLGLDLVDPALRRRPRTRRHRRWWCCPW